MHACDRPRLATVCSRYFFATMAASDLKVCGLQNLHGAVVQGVHAEVTDDQESTSVKFVLEA